MPQGNIATSNGSDQFHLPDITSGDGTYLASINDSKTTSERHNSSSNTSTNYATASSRRTSLGRLRENSSTSNQQVSSSQLGQRSSVQTQTSPSISSSSSSSSGICSGSSGSITSKTTTSSDFDLPPVALIQNSTLVRQRASVADQLAAASLQTGASLPLMIGNRPKCVVNLLAEKEPELQQQSHLQSRPQQATVIPTVGPQNTAMRAEQRRQQNAVSPHVSIVRPVISSSQSSHQIYGADGLWPTSKTDFEQQSSKVTQSLLDDWMTFDKSYARALPLSGSNSTLLDELLLAHHNHQDQQQQHNNQHLPPATTELEIKRRLFLLRREEHELTRGVRRQHQFVLAKLEERKRQLDIIRSIWLQRDFRHAMEKLVDIYQQGLIFTTGAGLEDDGKVVTSSTQLKSLNTSLVVDVISIIILRPRLWTLDICQLLLPIINQDLLLVLPQQQNNKMPAVHLEYYTEIGLKALRLIVTNFSSIIKSTLESLSESSKLVGIDLSREDRINKCLACYKLLLDSRTILSHSSKSSSAGKLAVQARELQDMLSAFFGSIKLEPSILARRLAAHSTGDA